MEKTTYLCKRCHFRYVSSSTKPRCPRCRCRKREEVFHDHREDDTIYLRNRPSFNKTRRTNVSTVPKERLNKRNLIEKTDTVEDKVKDTLPNPSVEEKLNQCVSLNKVLIAIDVITLLILFYLLVK